MKILILLVIFTAAGEAWVSKPPLGLDLYIPAPATNPITREKIALGRQLFFDKRLSRDGTLSCANCHDPKLSFSDGRTLARGIGGAEGTRNAPALINRGYGATFFWDGRTASLEQQALEPIFNPKEMALIDAAELERKTKLKPAEVAAALATYVRTIRSANSPYDQYAAGNSRGLNALEKSGLNVFRGKGQCDTCHAGSNFTDERFHNTGVAWQNSTIADEGRFAVSSNNRDHGAFKTPTLREVSHTAPYMHDGSLKTLEAVVDFYSEGGRANPYIDAAIRPRRFNSEEKRALVAFLQSLNGAVIEGPR